MSHTRSVVTPHGHPATVSLIRTPELRALALSVILEAHVQEAEREALEMLDRAVLMRVTL